MAMFLVKFIPDVSLSKLITTSLTLLHALMTIGIYFLLKYPLMGERHLYFSCQNERISNMPSDIAIISSTLKSPKQV